MIELGKIGLGAIDERFRHEADGGAWKNTAILSIKEWLVKELTDVTVLA